MRLRIRLPGILCLALLLADATGSLFGQETTSRNRDAEPSIIPCALLPFQERGGRDVKSVGQSVTDLLFAELVAKPEMYLVEREDLAKIISEQELNLTGAVQPEQAVQIGQLTGARILITGSVVQTENTVYLVAKIIGTETTRVLGASVKGRLDDDLSGLTGSLADAIAKTITTQSDRLLPAAVAPVDRLAVLREKLGKGKKPALTVSIREQHLGQTSLDPAAETRFLMLARETGFTVLDRQSGNTSEADVVITGEGLSAFGSRIGNLASVKSRLEVKAVDRKTGRVLAVDRQTVVTVDLNDQIAGKTGLEEAAARIAERLLPRLISDGKK